MELIQRFTKLQSKIHKYRRDEYVKMLGEAEATYFYKTWNIASAITISFVMMLLATAGLYQNVRGTNSFLIGFCILLIIAFVSKADWMIGFVQTLIYKIFPFKAKGKL